MTKAKSQYLLFCQAVTKTTCTSYCPFIILLTELGERKQGKNALFFFIREIVFREFSLQGFPKVFVRKFLSIILSIEVHVSFDFQNGLSLKCSLF